MGFPQRLRSHCCIGFQIQTQDVLEAAMAADDKDKLQQALQSNQAQVSFIEPEKPDIQFFTVEFCAFTALACLEAGN